MKLFYRTYGKGYPVIALHGLYASSDSWMGLASALANSYQLILVDQRNHGKSPHSPDFSYPLMSDDLLELMDELSLPKAILVGHSMGGKTAMHFCLHHPERVCGLIVEDISPLAYTGDRANVAYHRMVISAMLSLQPSTIDSREEAEQALYKLLPDMEMCRFLLKNLQRTAQGNFEWRFGLDYLANSFLHIMDGVNEPAVSTTVPTLFVKGAESSYILEQDETVIRQLFTNVNIVSIANADHWVHTRQPEGFTKIVKQHLSSLNCFH